MTKLLQNAFERLAKLPEDEQDAYAAILLEEVDSEDRWLKTLGETQNVLETLADEALKERKCGTTTPLDFDAPFAKE